MQTHTSDVFWPARSGGGVAFGPLAGEISCEIAVVGGGISGALAAWRLAEAGADVVVIDRASGGQESTAASTGLLLYELDVPMVELARRYGESAAARVYELALQANRRFGRIVAQIDDSCELLPRTSLYLASEAEDVPGLEAEFAMRKRHGFALQLLGPDEIGERFGFSRPAALFNSDAWEIDAYRLTQGILHTAIARGLRAFGDCQVSGYEPVGDGVRLRCASGGRVLARHVVFATGYGTGKFIGRSIGQLATTYAIATQPLGEVRGWEKRSLIWETARPYFYVRDTADGRAICGGGDEPGDDPALKTARLEEKAAMLCARLAELFPSARPRVEHAWASTFGNSKDGMPFIGQLPEFPRAIFVLAFGGNGITFSLIAADILRDQYLGKANPDAALFRFDR